MGIFSFLGVSLALLCKKRHMRVQLDLLVLALQDLIHIIDYFVIFSTFLYHQLLLTLSSRFCGRGTSTPM